MKRGIAEKKEKVKKKKNNIENNIYNGANKATIRRYFVNKKRTGCARGREGVNQHPQESHPRARGVPGKMPDRIGIWKSRTHGRGD